MATNDVTIFTRAPILRDNSKSPTRENMQENQTMKNIKLRKWSQDKKKMSDDVTRKQNAARENSASGGEHATDSEMETERVYARQSPKQKIKL